MNRQLISVLFLIFLIGIFAVNSNADINLQSEWFGDEVSPGEKPVELTIESSDIVQTRMIFNISGAELISSPERIGVEVEIPGEGHTSVDGAPSLPSVSRLIAIPARAKVMLEYKYAGIVTRQNVKLLPTMEKPVYDMSSTDEIIYDEAIYSADRMFPSEIVTVSDPFIMRDLRIVRVTVNPLRYNPVRETLELYKNVEVTLKYTDGGNVNTKDSEPTTVTKSFAKIYSQQVANFNELDLDVDQEWGTMLIIAPSNYMSYVQPLVDWKTRKGINVVMVSTNQTGTSSSQIKAYIQNAYNTWDPKLEYLILIGDTGGNIAVAASNSTGDHDYSRLEGNDILADIAVGRFSCATTQHLQTEVAKVVGYESDPYMGATEWYKRGAVYVGSGSGISPVFLSRSIRMKALLNGYTEVDTMWWYMPSSSVVTFTNGQINEGVTFYNYRGYLGMSGYSISNINNNLTNYFKLPFVATITCGTGDIVGSDSDYPEEFFRVGTPVQPKGAIGAIGTATYGTNTRFNNCMDNGLFGAFFDYDLFQMGDAMVSGKLDMYLSFPDNLSTVTNFSNWNNLIGDPSCQLWTDIPKTMSAEYPDTIPLGSSSIDIEVIDLLHSTPLEGAEICVSGGELNMFAIADEAGSVHFNLPALTAGTYLVTCSLHDYKPHLGSFIVAAQSVFVNAYNFEVDDDNTGSSSGNGDGIINPGETIELGVSLKNYGSSAAATNVTATLSTLSEFITIADSTQTYQNLAPGVVSSMVSAFLFTVSQDAYNGYELPFNLNVTTTQGGWDSYFPLSVTAPEIVYQNHQVLDPNGKLDPGDQSEVSITLRNMGGLTGENLQAVISCQNSYISFVQSISQYGTLAPGQSTAGDNFEVNVSPLIVPGTTVHFNLNITGDNGFHCTTSLDLVVGTVDTDDPMGPDEYGYYALDNTDTEYSGYPTYDWIEIDPTFGGSGTMIPLTDYGNEGDDSEALQLPFTFRYYGQDFNDIAVCSNGWLAMGADMAYYTYFRNWYIPSTLGPYSLVAPFWDDLYLMSSPPGKVYKYYDTNEHIFIIEWSRTKNYAPGNPLETFQVVLYDSEYYPTLTGDGEILFQYFDVTDLQGQYSDNHYATVGIKSNDNLDGLQYVYWNHYSNGAAVLEDGRAIKFSTNVPMNLSPPVIVHDPYPNVLEQIDGYEINVHIASWTSLNYDSLFVYWSTDNTAIDNQLLLRPLSSAIPGEFTTEIPEQSPGSAVYYYIFAVDANGSISKLPETAPGDYFVFLVGPQIEVLYDDVESVTGWTLGVPGDDATTGIWIRDDPVISIADNTHVVQPEDDHTPDPAHICFVTGNAEPGDPGGTNDVDGGKTTLLSPVYDLSNVQHPTISYWYWYSNNQGLNPNEDFWKVDITNNGGSSWSSVVYTNTSTPEMWMQYQFMVEDYVTPTDAIQLRFIASDEISGSLVEACVDDIRIFGIDTTWNHPAPGQIVPPSKISMSLEGSELQISWEPVQGASSYLIYESTEPYFNIDAESFVAEVETAWLILTVAENEARHFYRIVVVY